MRNKINLVIIVLVFAAMVAGQKVSVHLVNFQNDQRQPFTKEHAEQQMAQVVQWFADQGPVRYEVTVNDWVTLPINATCDGSEIFPLVDTSADRTVVAFPRNLNCGFTGRAGGREVLYTTDQFRANTVAHELAHIVREGVLLPHSASSDLNQYGDFFCSLGDSSRMSYLNLFQREKAGWVILPIVGTGTYLIPSYGAVKVWIRDLYPLSYDEYRVIEYRNPTGFDSWMLAYGVQNGVMIRMASDTSYLIDTTPNSNYGDLEWLDSPLTVGRTYTDGEFSVSVNSITEAGAMVSITAPNVVPDPTPGPTPTPTPTPCKKTNPKGKCVR
jgi:hypothetical protein